MKVGRSKRKELSNVDKSTLKNQKAERVEERQGERERSISILAMTLTLLTD